MQIRERIKTTTPQTPFEKDLESELLSFTRELAQVVNKGIKFADNFDANILTVADTGNANSENTVAHTLKRVPTGMIMIKNDKAGVVYASATAWTSTNIYIKCSVANCAVTLLVF